MPDTILVATSNPGKIREILRVLDGAPVTLVTLAELGPSTQGLPAPDETGRTFAENAVLKARHYALASGRPTVAEDSGLAIDALDGRPGVESARYPGATYADKFANLYRELASHRRPWSARFVCSLTFVDREEVIFTCEAAIEGEIAPAPRGENGFGYDPIFFHPPLARTLGELSDAEKLGVSHRGQAFRRFRQWLETPAE